jgi:uncharacterized membrane protein YoaK (UPF0700 family)
MWLRVLAMSDPSLGAIQPRLAEALLSFVAGFVDTLCFVALFGLFTAHVTGNFVLIGSELVQPSQGVLLKWLAFPAFVLGVVVARLLVHTSPVRPTADRRRLLLVQGLLLATGLLAGGIASTPHDLSSSVAGLLVAGAMGVQNAAARLVWGALSPTTVMTGNVTQLVVVLVDAWRGCTDATPGAGLNLVCPILAFAAGAVCGAYAYAGFGFCGLLLPIVLLALVAARA